MRILPLFIAFILPLFCCFTCASDNAGNRFFSTDDHGIVTTSTQNKSSGGPTSLLSGGSQGTRDTTRIEAQHPVDIEVGAIHIRGPIDSSTRAGERGFIVGGVSRALAQTKSIAKMFDFAGRKVEAEQITDRARNAADAANGAARIESTTEQARIAAGAE